MTTFSVERPITRPANEPPGRRDYVLSLCRLARVRAELARIEADTIGIALSANEISPEVALQWLRDAMLAYDPYYDAPRGEGAAQ
jgi:hypothetical protein